MAFMTPAAPNRRSQRQAVIARNRSILPPTDVMIANILDCYDAVSEHHCGSWYGEGNIMARSLADETGHSLRTVIGVIAALSPATSWERNISLARTMLETGDCSHAFGNCINKARLIRNGEDPYDALGGRKVRSFFRNLLHPNLSGPVTIDRHAMSIAIGGRIDNHRTMTLDDKVLKLLDRPGVYTMVAGCYRGAAAQRNIAPNDLQSATWNYWREHFAHDTNNK